jgi:hypothetical protein
MYVNQILIFFIFKSLILFKYFYIFWNLSWYCWFSGYTHTAYSFACVPITGYAEFLNIAYMYLFIFNHPGIQFLNYVYVYKRICYKPEINIMSS